LCLALAVPAVVAAGIGVALYVTSDRRAAAAGSVQILYPFEGAVFPPEIPAPVFRWRDTRPEADVWRITVSFPDDRAGMSFVSHSTEWTPSERQWAAIKRRSLGEQATVTIRGARATAPENVLSQGHVRIGTSTDEVGAPLFYREVNLPFLEAVTDPSHIKWRFGPASSKERPPAVLEGLPACGNCHSFSSDGKTLGMEVDSGDDKGAYAIVPVGDQMTLSDETIISWSDYKPEDNVATFGLLCQVSPDGRYVAGTVKDQAVVLFRSDLMFSQLFFLTKGITAIYDRRTKTFAALPGADDGRFVQTNATWSPDGRNLVFARAEAYDLSAPDPPPDSPAAEANVTGPTLMKDGAYVYDLYRVPFNGGRGGRAEPLEGASHNGMSNYFPRYSPDGKWIVFCRARSYMLLQPDSALYIVPADGGQARRMRCNTHRMNSWHSWSPNGRWLVFCSKANGPYTQLWLTHIDEQGRDSPAVVLDRLTAPDRAANIPEFVNCAPDAIKRIHQQYLDDLFHTREGSRFREAGQYHRAEEAYRKALSLNPSSADAQYGLGLALSGQGRLAQAIDHLNTAAELDPDNANVLRDLAWLLATSPPKELRNGLRAVRLARRACGIGSGEPGPVFLDTLAAAYAEMGRFTDAVGQAEAALRQARKADMAELSRQIEGRLALYRQARPFRREQPRPLSAVRR